MTNDGFRALAMGIVQQAVEDYINGSKKERKIIKQILDEVTLIFSGGGQR